MTIAQKPKSISPSEKAMYSDFVRQVKLLPDTHIEKQKGGITRRDRADYYCCVKGFMICIEFKKRGLKARDSQLAALRKWQRAGARTAVCDTVAGAMQILREVHARMVKLESLEDSLGGYA